MTFRSLGFFASSTALAKPGMVLVKPTSINHSGTSASIGANGQVTFTAVTSLSLNGVFSADFDNYVIAIRASCSGDASLLGRYRASGTDASATNYTNQRLLADSTTVSAARTASQAFFASGYLSSTARNGVHVTLYGPNIAQPTASRCVTASGYAGGYIQDEAGTHSLSTSYDGVTFYLASLNMTGTLTVMGVRS